MEKKHDPRVHRHVDLIETDFTGVEKNNPGVIRG